MSEPKLISPMLDGFVMGDPISEHHGIRCCPAMVKESGAKYIVKIISIPASQVQLEALLITGACSSEAAALSYFKDQAQTVVEEVDTLRKLSKLEGFIPFEGCKIVPMENEVGYDVYLLSSYKRSLEGYMRKHSMTHLAAVNLGLDMCASLAVCRQAGFLYVNLKPENIYISPDQEYRIGDLGFIKLDSLKYASLPDKYRSAYTAPEIHDAYAQINTTVDVYAAGMILYQAYNGGILPQVVSGEPLVAPAFADNEMAEIILKACAPDPADRWADPVEMGQALVAYMQKNGANNDPIVPPVVQKPVAEPVLETESTPDEAESAKAAEAEASEETAEQLTINEFADSDKSDETDEETAIDSEITNLLTETDEDAVSDESLEISYDEVSEDIEEILAQADNLIDHELPAPPVAPDPIEVSLPEPEIEQTPEQEEVPTETEEITEEETETISVEEESEEYDEECEDDYEESSGSGRKILTALLVLILLAGLAFGGYFFYKNFYLKAIDTMTLQGDAGRLTVQIETELKDELLSIVCIDTHGTRMEKPVVDGSTTFDGLSPNMLYNVKVEVKGLRKLTGSYTDTYTTPSKSTILNLVAFTGVEEGSVMLSFNVDGADSDMWIVSYAADGENVKTESFSGHFVSISGLTMGQDYTFILESADPLFLAGETQITYTVKEPVFAQDLLLGGLDDESIEITWNAPENSAAEKWTVHCFSDNGYDQTVTVDETTATFSGIDPAVAHTVEVIAEGMSTGTRIYMTANAVSVTEAKVQVDGAAAITVTWNGPKVDSKWIVVYSPVGYDRQESIRTDKNEATLTPVIPGTSYKINIQLEDGTTVFGGYLTAEVPEASRFNGKKLGLFAKDVDMDFSMCLRPEKTNWNRKDVKKDMYMSTFAVGEKAAFVVYVPSKYSTAKTSAAILYLIRDEEGNMIDYSSQIRIWRDMWKNRYCELDIPQMPEEPGKYTMEIYFNGGLAHTQEFEITAD